MLQEGMDPVVIACQILSPLVTASLPPFSSPTSTSKDLKRPVVVWEAYGGKGDLTPLSLPKLHLLFFEASPTGYRVYLFSADAPAVGGRDRIGLTDT